MKSWLRQYLTAEAQRELATREQVYPEKVRKGELAQEIADADLSAWRAIAALFDHGSIETGLSWGELELATSRALIARSQAADAHPERGEYATRRDAVAAIHERIASQRETAEACSSSPVKQVAA